MKSHTDYLTFNLPTRVGFVNITPQVEEAVMCIAFDFGPWEQIFYGEFDEAGEAGAGEGDWGVTRKEARDPPSHIQQ